MLYMFHVFTLLRGKSCTLPVEVRRQFKEVSFPLPPCGSQGWNLRSQLGDMFLYLLSQLLAQAPTFKSSQDLSVISPHGALFTHLFIPVICPFILTSKFSDQVCPVGV